MDKRVEKLLNQTISKKELEALLNNFGFRCRSGKGSHMKWIKKGCDVIIIASHSKEVKPYQIKQVIQVLRKGGFL